MRRFAAATVVGLGLGLALTACRQSLPPPEPPPDDPFAEQPYRSDPLPEGTKVLLVAGGDDIANFAAEVLEQRELWKTAGLSDDEIACYYAKPSEDALREDGKQLGTLAEGLRDCYPADPALVHEHLRQIAQNAPPFVYLYVTSHGLPPLLRWKVGTDNANELPRALDLRRGEIGRFDRHVIGLEGGPGPGLGDVIPMLEAHRAGRSVDSLIFSPDTLAAALEDMPAKSAKIIVLQACFSGGFIGRPHDDGPSPLTRMPNTTMLTATAPGQPSFGCSAGAHRTYYGGAFNRVLKQQLEEKPALPPALPWAAMHEQALFVVETMEFIDGESPSRPQFFTNVPGAANPKDASP